MKRQKGFTLVELLIVVVIIGILVSISIPIFTAQMHKAEVAADWPNLRAYYAEIQADYMSTQQQNPKDKNSHPIFSSKTGCTDSKLTPR